MPLKHATNAQRMELQQMEPLPRHVRTTDTSPGNPRKIHDDA
jgi:hypothetical protein